MQWHNSRTEGDCVNTDYELMMGILKQKIWYKICWWETFFPEGHTDFNLHLHLINCSTALSFWDSVYFSIFWCKTFTFIQFLQCGFSRISIHVEPLLILSPSKCPRPKLQHMTREACCPVTQQLSSVNERGTWANILGCLVLNVLCWKLEAGENDELVGQLLNREFSQKTALLDGWIWTHFQDLSLWKVFLRDNSAVRALYCLCGLDVCT